MPRLQVTIGPHRFDMAIAAVNDSTAPTEINTDLFVGRVLVRIKDFEGVPQPGRQAIRDSEYFNGRSRKFAILIEGRFKNRPGVEPYTGDEVQFGSDFDHVFTTFPRAPFNTGMKIAQWIDPATRYEETPPSGRPFIMSPYAACMNTLCAYPSPGAFSKALVLAHHPHGEDEEEEEAEGGIIPMDDAGATGSRKERQYWRFVGLKGTPAVDKFLETHLHLLSPHTSRPSSPSAPRSSVATSTSLSVSRPPLLLRRLGTSSNIHDIAGEAADSPDLENHESNGMWGAAIPNQQDTVTAAAAVPAVKSEASLSRSSSLTKVVKKVATVKPSRFSLATLKSALDRNHSDGLHAGDLITADLIPRSSSPSRVPATSSTTSATASPVDALLGPWRFGEEGVDVLEDTTFVFLDPARPHTVAQRRKWFCAEGGKRRKEFIYDSEVVYAASFFSNFCDFNTFDLKMGPLNLNIASHFSDQPVRYTLRSTRMAPRPDGSEGPEEEECFATIAFELVD